MKVIATTSNSYQHLIPVFLYLFKKYWNWPCVIVGYDRPKCTMPDGITFHSMGEQRGPKYFSDDLRIFFETQDETFIWVMEDTFIRQRVDVQRVLNLCKILNRLPQVGRMNLTGESLKQTNEFLAECEGERLYLNGYDAKYRLSTQPSIWRKKFLLNYLTPGMNPWEFETQPTRVDGWQILGPETPAVVHNEGVRRFDLHELNLDGIEMVDLNHIKTLL